MHHIFKALQEINDDLLVKAPTVIAKSLEKFTAMTVAGVQIKDSYQLLNCGLDKLVENLKDKGLRENKTLKENFPTPYTYCL